MSPMNMSRANVAGVDVDTRHWIGGRRVGSAATFPDISPVDERPIAEIARGAETEADAAVQAARQAFSGWAATPPEHRAKILNPLQTFLHPILVLIKASQVEAIRAADI